MVYKMEKLLGYKVYHRGSDMFVTEEDFNKNYDEQGWWDLLEYSDYWNDELHLDLDEVVDEEND